MAFSEVAMVSLTMLLWFGLVVPGPPAEAAPSCAPPRLSIAPQGRVDLGEVGPLEQRAQRFTFTNTSGEAIALQLLDLAPGVTVAGPALGGPIAAHASADLELTLDPRGWAGPQVRKVTLGTDDPRQGRYFLPVAVLVRPDLAVDATRRDFGDVAVPGSPQQAFTFVRETGAPTVLEVAQALPPYLELEQERTRTSVRLVFTLRTDRVPPGERLGFERIAVATNAPLQPTFDLYLAWKVHHAIEASPSRVVFQDRKAVTKALSLHAPAGQPFRLLQAEVEGGGFQVERAPGTGATQVLTIRRTAQGQARATLVLRFEGEEAPLRVPLAFLPAE
jgi:hypothetical protein